MELIMRIYSQNKENLYKLLQESDEGKLVLASYGPKKKFLLSKLSEIIIKEEFRNNPEKKISTDKFIQIAEEIHDVFIHEPPEIYYVPYIRGPEGKPKAARGKLWSTYIYFRKNYRKLGLLGNSNIETVTVNNQEVSADLEEDLQWLENNIEPWIEIETWWQRTTHIRLQRELEWETIEDYYIIFPCLKTALGYRLNGQHINHLQITLEVDGENLILDLTLNKQLIPKGFFQKHQENGKNLVYRPTKEEVDHCHYNGKVRGKPNSWVAISTCNGLSGVIFDGEEMHYLEKDNTINDSSVETNHFIYKHSNLVEHNKTCGYAGGAKDPEHTHSTTDDTFLRDKRSTENHELIRGPYNANKESKYVELVLVVDNRKYKELGEDKSRAIDQCKKIANIINGLYAPLNIFIALVGVVIWSEHDEMTFSPNGDSTLKSFLHYRKEKLIPEHPNDNAQLLTKFRFNGGVVGRALKGPICTYEYSGGINTDHSPVVGLVATTIAHMMGHNFGLEHDTTECKCPDEHCIMTLSSPTVATAHWSSCSLDYLRLAFTHGMDYCLKNKPESLFDSPVCGNGFVEPGEQCDCGLPEHCDNTCCNASTCMLYSNASCATGECCDLTTCKPKNAGTLCRSADHECDLPEYCTGQSEYCPNDVYKLDTEVCDEGKAFCYHGSCRTRSDQCKLLWGKTGNSSDNQCYELNIKGNRHGNCGYNKPNQTYSKCDQEDVLCGMLHCTHENERLEFGMESVAILSNSFINKKGSIISCKTAIVDLGTDQIDPGLTPDGAKCGEGKMCVNQKCRDVMSLRKQSPTCEKDCNGKGWCNNKGHCHCMDGYAPPFCESPGPGGSEDSGPASDPNASIHPVTDFSLHTLVKPKIYHGREKRQISTTKQENGEHVNHLQITLEVDGENLILDLTLNKQLIPKGFFQKHQENGKNIVYKPTKEEVDHCHYNGKVRGKPNSWVAVSTCNGLSGVIFDGEEMHYLEKDNTLNDSSVETNHFIYKHSNLVEHNKTCGYAGGAKHTHSTTDNRFLRYKRSTENHELIRGPYNANKESKYVELVLVVDNREYKELGESKSRVVDHCKKIANIINGLYAPLNIFIALVGVVIWSEHDEMTFSPNGDSTLTSFLHYRKEKLIPEHPNDNAQLLTKFNFDHGVVGKALKGPMCTYEYSGGVNTDHSPVVGLVATTIAHEMGHNFGMEHDTTECKCPDERCIMAPSSSTVAPTHWSSCSLNYLLLAFTHGMDYCLKNKPESLFDSPVCGNGFVEPGEQCDCGLPEHCDNTCCNASTCMLYSNASCATGECCDLMTCKPKNAGTLCRSADYECDLPEYCTGQSEYCPDDIYKLDTEVCDEGKSFCYHGFCRTRTDQCKLLWGETGKSSDDQCYEMNTKGSRHGNCGYNKFNQSYFKCDQESVLCGMLHCKHLNERLEFGMESVAILSHSFINKKGSIIPCRTAIVDLGTNQIDPGLTPDGAKCGEGKMCVNQKCRDVMSLRKQSPTCEKDCNGKGWCNNKGHCHCMDGFAPPFCEYPGPGGSEDSGPASDPNARQGVVVAMFIIFLGVIPTLALIAFLMYYAKYNMKFGWKKSPSTTAKSPNKSRGPPFPNEVTKRTEDNHSLLHEDSPPPNGIKNEFFGNFRGFSLTPMKKEEPEPVRPAPPPPVPATIGWNLNNSNANENYQKPPPPVPTVTLKAPKSSLFSKPVQKMNSFRNSTLVNGIKNSNNTATVPALPPPNPGSTARPIISSPVLESSTSSAKELISPLRNAPKVPFRPAPEAPKTDVARPLSNPEVPVVHTVLDVNIEPAKKNQKDKEKENIGTSALNRITSFLKPSEKKPVVHSNSLPKTNQVKAQKILDKKTLRNLEISGPLPQTQIDLAVTAVPVDTAKKTVVMRAQSMRTKPKERPNIQTFGSMRQPAGYKRPLSIPSANRPKSPPPPAPPLDDKKVKSSDKLNENQNQYDDCLNEAAPLARLSEENSPTSGDNIYAVIDETLSPEKVKSSAGSSESMGLLGEIVSEIQHRNFDSIYSTSTLSRKRKEEEAKKKKEAEALSPESSEYANSSMYKSENEYSNMGNLKSSASSTSSGYILPSAVNVPVKGPSVSSVHKPLDKEATSTLSSFKSDASTKPFASTFKRPAGPLASGNSSKRLSDSISDTKNIDIKAANAANSDNRTTKSKNPISPVSKTAPSSFNKTPPKNTINRQVTPPNLRSRKPSPTRSSSQASTKSNRSVTNSPDLVTSCNTNSGSKGPDVLNGGTSLTKKPSISSNKPTINTQKPTVKTSNINSKSVSGKSLLDKKSVSDVKPPLASKVTKANSDLGTSKTASTGVKNAARSNSNVASLQQKFEEKNNAKITPKGKA